MCVRVCVCVYTHNNIYSLFHSLYHLPQEVIMVPLDHKNLDKDVPYFANVVR